MCAVTHLTVATLINWRLRCELSTIRYSIEKCTDTDIIALISSVRYT